MEKLFISRLLFSVADSYSMDIDSPVCQVHCLCSGEIREYTISGSQHEAARLELPTTAVTEKRVQSNLTGALEVYDIQSIITVSDLS